jgi:hypothetical protein
MSHRRLLPTRRGRLTITARPGGECFVIFGAPSVSTSRLMAAVGDQWPALRAQMSLEEATSVREAMSGSLAIPAVR